MTLKEKKTKVLICLDTDKQNSTFDSIVALDSGVDHLLTQASVTPENVTALVHGAMFTRGNKELCKTAIFIGGSHIQKSEEVFKAVTQLFFGPVRVSVMLDPNGANTTAAATVLSAAKHLDLSNCTATLLGASGPIGQRIARLLVNHGTTLRLGSRSLMRANTLCEDLFQKSPGTKIEPFDSSDPAKFPLESDLIISAGAAGVELLTEAAWNGPVRPKVVLDLNAVSPLGIAGVDSTDKNKNRNGTLCYGAFGVGGLKMKIHKLAIQKLFTQNDLVLDIEEIYQLGKLL